MGGDIKVMADESVPAISALVDGVQGFSISQATDWVLAALLALAVAAALVRMLPKVWAGLEKAVLTNWRLALIGSAALLLSLAGGWTTWDGMRNFTGESVLSAMFTFGIHGIMLIVAWLIGESFATGMKQVPGRYGRTVSAPMVALSLLGGGLVVAGLAVAIVRIGVSNDQLLYGLLGAGALLLAVAALMLFSKSDVIQPYAQGLRIIARNAMLWVMFLACMATSVFFSFDSRFNVIFPKDQRERAAEIRTKNQVAGVVADIGETIASRRLAEAERLFHSEGWHAYEEQLTKLSRASEGAEGAIEAHFTRQMETHRAAIAEQQERIATATSGQAGLASKKITLTDELSRLKAERPGLAADLSARKSELDARAKEIDAKRVEAMAEDRGVEGTLKAGKGPVYRERVAELARLRDYYKIGEERVKDAQKRLDVVDARIAQIERELAGVDGELAKLKGEAVTAEQRIAVAQTSHLGEEGRAVDPARMRTAFERARAEFRQDPSSERLGSLHQHCVQLYDAMASTEATRERIRDVDCDPKQAVEAAAIVFALDGGLKAFAANCAGSEKVPTAGGVDPLLSFGRNCLRDSGLPSTDANALGERLSFIDLNRDDKAHNFVVTLNAFQDGNRLAYLALAIAIGIDSLIFMTGLFGANAVRSPLSDVPNRKARNSQELNAMIEAALLPDVFRRARLVVQAMHPIENADGYSSEVRLGELAPETAVQVRSVLNAGAMIGAVRGGTYDGHYLVRAELIEFLNSVIRRELEMNRDMAERGLAMDRLEEQIVTALLPDVPEACETVLGQLVPIDEAEGFSSELCLADVPHETRPVILNVLNSAAAFSAVQRDRARPDTYFVHKDLYQTLARIRAREVARVGVRPKLRLVQSGDDAPEFGGSLTPVQAAIADHTRRPSLEERGASETDGYLTALVQSLGVEGDAFISLSGSARDAARLAGEAMFALRQSNRSLDQELARRDQEAHGRLERAIVQLQGALQMDDGTDRQKLADASDEIERYWDTLMLLPHGPYELALADLVEQLEPDSGAGTLRGDEQVLLATARNAHQGLVSNPRRTDRDWLQLEQQLQLVLRTPMRQAVAGHTKRTLN